ncbi:hypothetical protein CDO52_15820 [Nocardiopsis gilva YIM 90087]|uniref:DUF4158 domain-containing protein n=1 Tax=Nocardiopsis gilva YIM 90087 TaxID=1235441 RepID=A0A223S7G6_9ACTN|nr:DUF4158 domain-containing protein [Nocardiopsis gilva]ASU84061.1 hypothetical protein CDO52_15820 [Nocardiopsis gilva YIM 90087]
MPVEFLTDEQAARYGRYAEPPSRAHLDRFFHLGDADWELIAPKRREANRLGFAVQLCTARSLGTFLTDPSEVPENAVVYLAEQLGIADPGCLADYAAREQTRLDHAEEIRDACRSEDFATKQAELRAWMEAQVWTAADGPKALFDGAVSWLLRHAVLLPGVTTLARLVARVRQEVTERLWTQLCTLLTPGQQAGLGPCSPFPTGHGPPTWSGCAAGPPAARARRWCAPWTESLKSSAWDWAASTCRASLRGASPKWPAMGWRAKPLSCGATTTHVGWPRCWPRSCTSNPAPSTTPWSCWTC